MILKKYNKYRCEHTFQISPMSTLYIIFKENSTKQKRPLGYINPRIYDKIALPKNFGKSVRRMQMKRVQKKREEFQEQKRREKFDERYKLIALKKQIQTKLTPLLFIEIALSPNRTEVIKFYEGDNPEQIVELFCAKYKLSRGIYESLLNRLIEEIKSFREESSTNKSQEINKHQIPTNHQTEA